MSGRKRKIADVDRDHDVNTFVNILSNIEENYSANTTTEFDMDPASKKSWLTRELEQRLRDGSLHSEHLKQIVDLVSKYQSIRSESERDESQLAPSMLSVVKSIAQDAQDAKNEDAGSSMRPPPLKDLIRFISNTFVSDEFLNAVLDTTVDVSSCAEFYLGLVDHISEKISTISIQETLARCLIQRSVSWLGDIPGTKSMKCWSCEANSFWDSFEHVLRHEEIRVLREKLAKKECACPIMVVQPQKVIPPYSKKTISDTSLSDVLSDATEGVLDENFWTCTSFGKHLVLAGGWVNAACCGRSVRDLDLDMFLCGTRDQKDAASMVEQAVNYISEKVEDLNRKERDTYKLLVHLFHAKMLQGAWIVSERTL